MRNSIFDERQKEGESKSSGPIVAAYYFPNFHVDPRNEKEHGRGWTEWQILKVAHPRFPEHDQPRVPLWGYEDEADPQVMEKKIAAAADHGVNCFIFDWYHYQDGPFLERCLEEGFLGAENNDRMKFCCMWANHDWIDLFPAKFSENPFLTAKLLYPAAVDWAAFDRIIERVVSKYFSHPSHLLIDGCPYFSVYEIGKLIHGFGGVDEARAALDRFRDATRKAGFPDLHLNAIVWGNPILPGETKPADIKQVLHDLGFDSFASYVYVHHGYPATFPATPYSDLRANYLKHWDEVEDAYDLPYIPNVTMGWDPSPRTTQSDNNCPSVYPFGAVVVNGTPDEFQKSLEMTKKRLEDRNGEGIPMFTINAWNEWTEGSYLEPDTRYGMSYLEAIRDVFGVQSSVASVNSARNS